MKKFDNLYAQVSNENYERILKVDDIIDSRVVLESLKNESQTFSFEIKNVTFCDVTGTIKSKMLEVKIAGVSYSVPEFLYWGARQQNLTLLEIKDYLKTIGKLI